ncbi:MAG TPA: hypothetical protein ENN64_00915, partial [bacterium]|nr:hypothetical protein [bacterium]
MIKENSHRKKIFKRYLCFGVGSLLIITLLTLSLIMRDSITQSQKERNLEANPYQNQDELLLEEKIELPEEINVCIEDRNLEQNGILTELERELSSISDRMENTELKKNATPCDIEIVFNPKNSSNLEQIWYELYVPVTQINSTIFNLDYNTLQDSILTKSKKIYWSQDINQKMQDYFNLPVGREITQEKTVLSKAKKYRLNLSNDEEIIGIIKFDNLDADLRIIPYNNVTPFSENFSLENYPFKNEYYVRYSDQIDIESRPLISTTLQEILYRKFENSKFDQDSATSILFTGRSELGTGILSDIRKRDPVSEEIKVLIDESKIALFNNESPIYSKCNSSTSGVTCGTPTDLDYLAILGFDIVDGSGNFSRTRVNETIKHYKDKNLKYFGIGENWEKAHTPKYIDSGSRFSFLAYSLNPLERNRLATRNQPGNAGPDSSISDMRKA